MVLVINGRCINPLFKQDEILDILIIKGNIAKMGSNLKEHLSKEDLEDCKIIDATDLIIAPGLVDVHVHFREPGFTHKEDIKTGAKAAARGGYTSIVLMANTKPVVDNIETLAQVLAQGKKTKINIYTCATITKNMMGKELVDIALLKEKGSVGFTDDGLPIMNKDVLRDAMVVAKAHKVPISLHEEDAQFIKVAGINEGEIAKQLNLQGASREAEVSMVLRDVELAKEIGANVNIQHISSKETVEILREVRKEFSNIHGEATPHHFVLTQDAVLAHGTLAKMNPPLREESDREAIIQGLVDNTIEIIATDHAPHSIEEKEREFAKAPSGIIGLETALSLGIMYLSNPKHLTLMELIEKMSTNPAQLYDIEGGSIEIGKSADLVIFSEKDRWVYDKSFSKSSNSPFLGQELQGKIRYTLCAGEVVYTQE